MEIKTKFNIGDEVFYDGNRFEIAGVVTRIHIETDKDNTTINYTVKVEEKCGNFYFAEDKLRKVERVEQSVPEERKDVVIGEMPSPYAEMSREKLLELIREKKELQQKMVGWLYPSILQDEIEKIREELLKRED